MAKKIKAILKLQIPAGKANPAPPIGPALGQHGVNIMGFCKEYNERTANMGGSIIPAEITIYEDRSFTFITKTPPTAWPVVPAGIGTLNIIITKLNAAPIASIGTCFTFKVFLTIFEAIVHIGNIST